MSWALILSVLTAFVWHKVLAETGKGINFTIVSTLCQMKVVRTESIKVQPISSITAGLWTISEERKKRNKIMRYLGSKETLTDSIRLLLQNHNLLKIRKKKRRS